MADGLPLCYEQLHRALVLNAEYLGALNSILENAKTLEEAKTIAAKVLLG